MRTRKKKRKRRIGASLVFALAMFTAVAGQAGEKKNNAEPYALVGGTVFQESGFALPNAVITLLPVPQGNGPAARHHKKQQTVSDARGEFVFRIPPGPMSYRVRATARGYASQDKPAAVQGEERVDVTFQLEPESK
jgi:Carboxypeptidase regulatory-like domain